jgi:hypothetical protein
MMWHTHAAIGASTGWLLTPFLPLDTSTNMAVVAVCAAVGALMPDLDAVEFKIKHIRESFFHCSEWQNQPATPATDY